MSGRFRIHAQKWCAGALLVLLFPYLCWAQQSVAPPKSLRLQDALNYALEHYPAVRAALEQVSAAHAGVTLARTQYLPQLSGVYQDSRATQNQVPGIWLPTSITPTVEGPIGGYTGQSYWGSQAAALFSWEPLDFGLRSARVAQARSTEERSRADLALTRLQVTSAVANYFLLAVANRQAIIAAQANVDRWQVFHHSIHVLVDNTLRPGADASRADAELARAKTQLYQSQQAERVAIDTLAALMGAAGNDLLLDPTRLLDLPPSQSLPAVAASEHPLARDQMATVHQTQEEEKGLQRTGYPRFLFQAEVFGRGSEIPDAGLKIGNWNGLAPARGNWITGITIVFPDVFGLKALGVQKQVARANEAAQRAHYDQSVQDLTGQIQAARDQLKTAQLIAQETPTELASARQSESQSKARYQAGLATLVEVAEAENLLAQAQMDDAMARLNIWRGFFGVAYAQGDLQSFLQLLSSPSPGGR